MESRTVERSGSILYKHETRTLFIEHLHMFHYVMMCDIVLIHNKIIIYNSNMHFYYV